MVVQSSLGCFESSHPFHGLIPVPRDPLMLLHAAKLNLPTAHVDDSKLISPSLRIVFSLPFCRSVASLRSLPPQLGDAAGASVIYSNHNGNSRGLGGLCVLQDPSVASSTVENKIQFLRSKNLTQEEINTALARTGSPAPAGAVQYASPAGPPQQYYPPYAQQAWQPPPPAPRRDWRDWFIMATVVSGVGYGLYSLSKRYVYPLIAPPTPERLEQDKKSIEEQFDKAFALVEQLARDTEALKDAEKQRTEKLDNAISELETVMSDLKSANRRREDDAQRIREDVQSLKDSIPKAMENQKTLTDNRLSEINTELTSLKTLVSQRMAPSASPATGTSTTSSSFPRSSGSTLPAGRSSTSTPTTPAPATVESVPESSSTPTPAAAAATTEAPKNPAQSFSRPPGFTSGSGSSTKASIPAWQMAAAQSASSATTEGSGKESGTSS
ncbi:Peroxisome membrane anchor protein Pex14p [Metarhizium guizhouense ARSEF 977]|uniref:Peroxisomal membrane protein PEX14 n=1 Tax=Metarhizium guizhouense (strain ARSEF 977) TaxID=1276136 RepID=A0A0B4HLA8_METGA|nr:Peroxisome membrane anchor protein Pex14p [Metarhizium guizhouense ARSEF 977]